MKKTGLTKKSTQQLISGLKKQAKESGGIYLDLARIMAKPRRQRASINLWKLEKLSRKFKDKTLVVPGKVLGYGSLNQAVNVAAFEYSTNAKEKIAGLKGKTLSFKELIEGKVKGKDLILVK